MTVTATGGGAYDQKLSRELSLTEVVFLAVSSAAPAGSVFMMAPLLIGSLGGASVAAMMMAATVAVCVGLCYGELATAYPIAGGEYTWAARMLNRPIGFAVFLLILVSGPGVVATQATAACDYLALVWPAAGGTATRVGLIAFVTVVAVLNVRTNSWITAGFLLIEVLVLLALAVLGFTNATRGAEIFVAPQFVDATGALRGGDWWSVLSVLPLALLSYMGFQNAVYFAEEATGQTLLMGRAILVSLAAMVMLELVPLSAVVIGAPSLPRLMAAASPIGQFVLERGGEGLGRVVSLGIVVALVNTMIVVVNIFARILFASARDRSWPGAVDRMLGTVHDRFRTPVAATVVMGVASAAASFLPYGWLIATEANVVLLTFGVVGVCALRVRRSTRPVAGGYEMPGWPLPPLMLILATLALAYRASQDTPSSLGVSVAMMGVGLLYYYAYIHPRRNERWTLPSVIRID